MNLNEYFEKESEVWKFKHKALTAAFQLFGLFINFNYATSEIDQVNDENVMVIFRNDENHTIFNRTIKVKWLEMAMEGNLELARMEMGGNNGKNEELEKRITENMARFGGSHEFWERRLTHGWDALEAKLSELHAKGLTDE
ncbi:MAG: hypothetical protein J6T74_02720, partial [Clostridia bacterium]|nr:hypothetical protein [Clostridia bacterium]